MAVTADDRVLLIMDGHMSHTALEVICEAVENGVDLLYYPGKLTHLLAGPDLSFSGPFKSMYNRAFG